MPVLGPDPSAVILAAEEHRVLVVVSGGGDLVGVVVVLILVGGFVRLQMAVSLLIAHVFWHVPLLKLLFVLHDIWKVLPSAIESGTVEVVLLFLLAFVVLKDLVAGLGALGEDHLALKSVLVQVLHDIVVGIIMADW